MFDQIARFYDLLNTVLSGGRDAAWRRRAAQETMLQPGGAALDVCTGTGKLARLLRRRAGAGGRVVGVDFSSAMLEVARRNVAGVEFRQGDATELDMPDASVDAVTVAFGLRNVVDRQRAVAEAFRVLRPGGRYVILEFAHVDVPLFGRVYAWYVTRVLPRIGRALNPSSGAYSYLPASIAAYPRSEVVSQWLRGAGFGDVRVIRMTLGIVSLHVATRPLPAR